MRAASGQTAPSWLPDPSPLHADPRSNWVSQASARIFTFGFRPDYTHWIQLPVFDTMGFP